jgi:hypothetical protein
MTVRRQNSSIGLSYRLPVSLASAHYPRAVVAAASAGRILLLAAATEELLVSHALVAAAGLDRLEGRNRKPQGKPRAGVGALGAEGRRIRAGGGSGGRGTDPPPKAAGAGGTAAAAASSSSAAAPSGRAEGGVQPAAAGFAAAARLGEPGGSAAAGPAREAAMSCPPRAAPARSARAAARGAIAPAAAADKHTEPRRRRNNLLTLRLERLPRSSAPRPGRPSGVGAGRAAPFPKRVLPSRLPGRRSPRRLEASFSRDGPMGPTFRRVAANSSVSVLLACFTCSRTHS